MNQATRERLEEIENEIYEIVNDLEASEDDEDVEAASQLYEAYIAIGKVTY
jgi:hypothetical protein